MTITLFAASLRAETQQSWRHASSYHPSESSSSRQRQNWFPPPAPPAAYTVSPTMPAPTLDHTSAAREQAIAPLPPAAATGLAGLAALGLFSARKGLKRFLLG
jgi:hypothetical protein